LPWNARATIHATTLISTLFQSHQDAAQSCAEHAQIVAALESGDRVQAIALLKKHIQAVANSLGTPTVQDAIAESWLDDHGIGGA